MDCGLFTSDCRLSGLHGFAESLCGYDMRAGIDYQVLTGDYPDKYPTVVHHGDEILCLCTVYKVVKLSVHVHGQYLTPYRHIAEIILGKQAHIEAAVVYVSEKIALSDGADVFSRLIDNGNGSVAVFVQIGESVGNGHIVGQVGNVSLCGKKVENIHMILLLIAVGRFQII